jgi:hypothetical protein
MNDETFFERLRHDASQLQFTVDEVTVVRLTARVRARVGAQPTVSQMLAGWLRPLAAVIGAIALAATLSLTWIESPPDNGTTIDQIAANTPEISVAGMTLAGE